MLRSLVGSEMCIRDRSTGRLHQTLLLRLKAVMTLLESSIGEAIPILKLKDPEFVRSCWQRLGDNDRHDVFSTLSSEASGSTPTTGRGAFPPTTEEGGDTDHAIFGDENEDAANHFRGGGGATSTTATAPGMKACLLYTSDAADEEDSVDLGGRRIIKKKKKKKENGIGVKIKNRQIK
eukprot:TRINITY_DN25873_c0_g1_i1.p1 TRINITY_DN25873_c0_g1~~TRINITY_DN25873_c0_g1_i1.p1  ORF type:complete len:178 (-),score=64.15 TRINITY_DN25873_c0_g1_i1:17-550(-)